jgi:DNA-binding NarL/FixJ family response regulator
MKQQPISFSEKELQIITMICNEVPIKAIASDMQITKRTVEKRLQLIREKIGCQTSVGMAVYVQKHKLVVL